MQSDIDQQLDFLKKVRAGSTYSHGITGETIIKKLESHNITFKIYRDHSQSDSDKIPYIAFTDIGMSKENFEKVQKNIGNPDRSRAASIWYYAWHTITEPQKLPEKMLMHGPKGTILERTEINYHHWKMTSQIYNLKT